MGVKSAQSMPPWFGNVDSLQRFFASDSAGSFGNGSVEVAPIPFPSAKNAP
jgi:hypothetical protein